jgi:hypothetical protein
MVHTDADYCDCKTYMSLLTGSNPNSNPQKFIDQPPQQAYFDTAISAISHRFSELITLNKPLHPKPTIEV